MTGSVDGPKPGTCGEWMPRAKAWCGRNPSHKGNHLTPEAVEKNAQGPGAVAGQFARTGFFSQGIGSQG